ncbi:MAG: helix-turn-helix transcriptional regulator [Spirochaetales bacterium]|nr:helix-turn-helix transcriptional regulator [Spirochaetales bacterium]
MFSLNYCGYNISNKDKDRIDRPVGSGDYDLIYFITPMNVHLDGRFQTAGEHSFLLYTPKHYQLYQAPGKFKNSFVHFDCDTDFYKELKIPVNSIFQLPDPPEINELIKNIEIEYYIHGNYYEQTADALINLLFIHINRQLHHKGKSDRLLSTQLERFKKIRIELLTNLEKEWTADSIAALANMSKSQFYNYYNTFFHRSPKADLIEARLGRAKYLLTNAALQVSQIAELSGFTNNYHFIRYFRKCFGCTPGQFRKKKG